MSGLITTKSLDLSLPVLPPRSILHPLAPLGVGTPQTESLTGYIARLAEEYHVTPGSLCTHIIAAKINKPYLIPKSRPIKSILSTSFIYGTPALNGLGVIAEDWVQALEKLTGRDDLRYLTALTWKDAVTDKLFTRDVRAWCPACLEEQRRSGGEIYEQLIWMFKIAEVCPKHKRPLETKCPHCRRQLRPLADRSRPGRCSRCSQWLSEINRTSAGGDSQEEDALQYKVWVATQVGELISVAPKLSTEPKRETTLIKIDSLVDTVTEGNLCALARTLGIKQETMQSWRRNRCIPQTDLLLRICYAIKISLLDFLTAEDILQLPEWNFFILPELIHSRTMTPRPGKEGVRRELINSLEENPPPSVDSVANNLGYKSTVILRRWFPALCKQLTAKRRSVVGNVVLPYSERGRGNNEAKLRQALELALEEQEPPSIMMVVAGVGYKNTSSIKRRFPDLYEKIKKRYREHKIVRKVEIRAKFKEMLNEDPPPSFTEAANRFGYKSISSFRENFADLYRELRERQRQHREKQIQVLLEVVLLEEIPPSLKVVAKRIRHAAEYLNEKFPEECKAIKRKRIEFIKQPSEKL